VIREHPQSLFIAYIIPLQECNDLCKGLEGRLNDALPQMARLNIDCNTHAKVCEYFIHEVMITMVVCGWSHPKWVC
jgi:hypothetical protein